MGAKNESYSVSDPDDSTKAVEWRWPLSDNPVWTMSEKDGVRWYVGDPLDEYGRQMLLEHFELFDQEDQLPLETISRLSPHDLEERCTKEHQPHKSSRVGDHIDAIAVY